MSNVELHPGQYVAGATFRRAYRVTTVRSMTYEDNLKTMNADYMDSPEECHVKALDRGHTVAWTSNPGFSIVSHDNSKELELERMALTFATILETGQHVKIEGQAYIVTLYGETFSDPISFTKI